MDVTLCYTHQIIIFLQNSLCFVLTSFIIICISLYQKEKESSILSVCVDYCSLLGDLEKVTFFFFL